MNPGDQSEAKPRIDALGDLWVRREEVGHQRLKAVCVLTDGRDYLLSIGSDPSASKDSRTFLIPVGGGIEFGELANAAVVREVKEETGIDIQTPHLLGVLENIFTWNGLRHEVIFCFLSQIPSRSIVPLQGRESNGETYPLRWLSGEELRSSPIPVYPDGLADLLLNGPHLMPRGQNSS